MGISRRGIAAVAMAGSMLAGGAVGATVFSAAPSVAATTPSTTAAAPATGTFKSNEDATHELGESAAREAQENAGQVPTVP
jgi:hypothetical protein